MKKEENTTTISFPTKDFDRHIKSADSVLNEIRKRNTGKKIVSTIEYIKDNTVISIQVS